MPTPTVNRGQIRRLERAARPLDPGTGDRRRLRNAVVTLSEQFLRELDEGKAFDDSGHEGLRLRAAPISEHGLPMPAALELLTHDVIRPGNNPASGGHLAYIPGGGLYHSALGDYLAAVTNKYSGIFFAGPGAVR